MDCPAIAVSRFTEAKAAAIAVQSSTGLWASLQLAQWADESNWGASMWRWNCFGIKYHSGDPNPPQLLWTHEEITASSLDAWKQEHPELVIAAHIPPDRLSVKIQDKFATYPSLAAAFSDHVRLLTHGRPYVKFWTCHRLDPKPDGYIRAFASTYATRKTYSDDLLRYIADWNFYRYDTAVRCSTIEEVSPASPAKA